LLLLASLGNFGNQKAAVVVFAQRPGKDKQNMESTENEPCPICRMDRYLNPQMTLLVSPCFHKMYAFIDTSILLIIRCESCINRIFAAGSAPCPQCGTLLRKSNFAKPVFDNMYVEKECRIRKRIWRM
jgi:CDK-activating kinase assembly factor MAT1